MQFAVFDTPWQSLFRKKNNSLHYSFSNLILIREQSQSIRLEKDTKIIKNLPHFTKTQTRKKMSTHYIFLQ